jgi:hypothetical protein
MFGAHIRIVRDAVDVVLRRIGDLPRSDGRDDLHARAEACALDASRWGASSPTSRDLDTLMKQVLAVHIELSRLERASAMTASGASAP